MKNLSMISKPQTGYTVKKAAARQCHSAAAHLRQRSYECFMAGQANTNIYYVGIGGMAMPHPRV